MDRNEEGSWRGQGENSRAIPSVDCRQEVREWRTQWALENGQGENSKGKITRISKEKDQTHMTQYNTHSPKHIATKKSLKRHNY